ncbi:type II toxin-antitoxin system RelE/ParE family toxin [Leeuwenhoekiella palythoae]|uniref:type II toxin-antitoxin system RelE/ParE family toxin n=1 Tax=Leeuwenhoekiella palythoae TaxID=573501 RepID=UPI00093486CB|nr:type II toxin-antitoxin system RelE/ParE family toxin [Leeuwenhoekiella palythoae]
MVQINWTYRSKIDLEDIFDYISRDSKKYAQIQILRILKRTQILKKLPYSGKVIIEIPKDDLRELIEGNYRIIYKIVSDSRIDILTVHHSSRDLTRRNL